MQRETVIKIKLRFCVDSNLEAWIASQGLIQCLVFDKIISPPIEMFITLQCSHYVTLNYSNATKEGI